VRVRGGGEKKEADLLAETKRFRMWAGEIQRIPDLAGTTGKNSPTLERGKKRGGTQAAGPEYGHLGESGG